MATRANNNAIVRRGHTLAMLEDSHRQITRTEALEQDLNLGRLRARGANGDRRRRILDANEARRQRAAAWRRRALELRTPMVRDEFVQLR